MYKMLRLIVIFRFAVISVILIGGTIGGMGEQAKIRKIHACHILNTIAALGDGQDMPLAHKEHHFVQLHRDVMMTSGQNGGFHAVVLTALYPHLQHLFRQIDIPAAGVLLVNGGNQQAFADHYLVLYLACKGVIGESKGQRHAVHAIAQGSFHVLTINVRQQQVAQLQNTGKGRLILKAVGLLFAGTGGGVVAQQGREDAHAVPAQHKVLGGVAAKAANVGAFVQETAHVQGGHHVQAEQNVAPPGLVIAGPDTAIPVHTDAGRAGVH